MKLFKRISSMKKRLSTRKVINHWFDFSRDFYLVILDNKQYVGCLVKSKYADQSDQIGFYLFENKNTRNFFLHLDLIEYDK